MTDTSLVPAASPAPPAPATAPGPVVNATTEQCPACNQHWAAGPEGDAWGRTHCWRCGFVEGQNQAPVPDVGDLQTRYELFSQMVRQAVAEAMSSEAQKQAEANAQALGPQGMASVAAQEQARCGFTQAPDPNAVPEAGGNG